MEVKYKLELYLLAQKADPGPPLGTILGNIGVNSTNFCKEFNLLTDDLPDYITISAIIEVFNNKTFKIKIKDLPLGKVIGLLKFERVIINKGKEEVENCIYLKDLVQLAKFKHPDLTLKQSIGVLLGTIKGSNLTILYKND